MRWFKSFHAQVQECKKTGNRFIIYSPNPVIVCVHFRTYCHNKACFEMRKKKGQVDLGSKMPPEWNDLTIEEKKELSKKDIKILESMPPGGY